MIPKLSRWNLTSIGRNQLIEFLSVILFFNDIQSIICWQPKKVAFAKKKNQVSKDKKVSFSRDYFWRQSLTNSLKTLVLETFKVLLGFYEYGTLFARKKPK